MDKKLTDKEIGPGVELADSNRIKLLKKLQNIFGQIPQKAQASFLLCDLNYLKELCQAQSASPALLDAALHRVQTASNVDNIVTQWCQKSRMSSRVSSVQTPSPGSHHQIQPSPLRSVTATGTKRHASEELEDTDIPHKQRQLAADLSEQRSQQMSDLCKNRDKYKCVVTKFEGPMDACHIVPFSLNQQSSRASFFELLRILWPRRFEKWQSIVNSGTEFIGNMLTLSPTLHRCHSVGLFGLQPVEASSDGKSMKLKFFWLAQRDTSSNFMTDITAIPPFPDNVQLKGIQVCNVQDGHLIKSGEIIELMTADPANKPLPDWDLLELQWVMQRLTALRGAADIFDSVHSESDKYLEMEVFTEKSSAVEEQDTIEGSFHKIHTWMENQLVRPQLV
ncbi:conserved hypothetical protein [Histoplasma capsulatum var. duboisii H88]|uniref:HNH nuclease domain-containing protein n=1 Tax=Ajellomyces capsulatus (strain H88) TaxID=544711 RepID=F0U4Z9_AJEC8|nr:conserved hypothetical protein [Histoplasma capsulatum var. duboisii H88]QSS51532.1 hypothetical protein I7I53_06881 [Histoplasma capsulatum var. duboisii H88]